MLPEVYKNVKVKLNLTLKINAHFRITQKGLLSNSLTTGKEGMEEGRAVRVGVPTFLDYLQHPPSA